MVSLLSALPDVNILLAAFCDPEKPRQCQPAPVIGMHEPGPEHGFHTKHRVTTTWSHMRDVYSWYAKMRSGAVRSDTVM